MRFNIFNLKRKRKRLGRRLPDRGFTPIEFDTVFMPANPTSVLPFKSALDDVVVKVYTEEEMQKIADETPRLWDETLCILSPFSPSVSVSEEEYKLAVHKAERPSRLIEMHNAILFKNLIKETREAVKEWIKDMKDYEEPYTKNKSTYNDPEDVEAERQRHLKKLNEGGNKC